MKQITCTSLKHTGQWQLAAQTPFMAFAGNMVPSIRGSYNDERVSGSFIEGWDD